MKLQDGMVMHCLSRIDICHINNSSALENSTCT